jgi:hypothetical protein
MTRNSYRILGGKRERTKPLCSICIHVVEDITEKELHNRGYEYELDLLSRGAFFNPSNEGSCFKRVGNILTMGISSMVIHTNEGKKTD